MKAISNPEHKALIAALRQLEELQQSSLHTIDVPFPADGFLQHIQSLNERFSHYQTLLCQLADCIAEYEAMHREVRVNVVVPALRQVKKEAHISRYRNGQHQLAVEYTKVVSGV